MSKRSFLALVAAAVLGLPGAAWAQTAAPKGRVVLTVSGAISKTNAGNTFQLDMAMIDALPQHSFTTRTPWYDRPVAFRGPRLSDLLALVGARGTVLHATAINDYKIAIPFKDAAEHPVIMASRIDGKPIPVREKGPLFVVYPFDSSAALRSSVYYERSIWQLKSIHIE